VPKLQGLYQNANPAPKGEKLPIDQDDHRPREFGNETTTTEGGALVNDRIKRASSASLPQTSPPHIALTVCIETDFVRWSVRNKNTYA
jgi:hypothetical protein